MTLQWIKENNNNLVFYAQSTIVVISGDVD